MTPANARGLRSKPGSTEKITRNKPAKAKAEEDAPTQAAACRGNANGDHRLSGVPARDWQRQSPDDVAIRFHAK